MISEHVSHSVVSDSATPGLQPTRLLCPWVSQTRVLEWVPCPSPGDLPDPGIEPGSPALQADSLPTEPPGEVRAPKGSFPLQSCSLGPHSPPAPQPLCFSVTKRVPSTGVKPAEQTQVPAAPEPGPAAARSALLRGRLPPQADTPRRPAPQIGLIPAGM